MIKPKKFQLTTDIPSMANDSDTTSITVNIPAGFSIAANSSTNYTADIVIGNIGASLYSSFETSLDGRTFLGIQMSVNGDASSSLGAVNFSSIAIIYRLSTTTVRLNVTLYNPYGVTITSTEGAFSVTANLRTFIPPFA